MSYVLSLIKEWLHVYDVPLVHVRSRTVLIDLKQKYELRGRAPA
jgi:hypothetical protein